MRALAAAALLIAAPAAAKVTVAVLYFDNDTTLREYDVLAKGMADMLITDLSAASELQLVERTRLETVIAEQKLQRTKYFDPKSAVKVGKLLGAQFTVTGTFTGFDPQVRIDVRMIDVESTKVVATAQVRGKRDGFFDLEQELVKKFLSALAQKSEPPAPGGALGLDAAVKYSQGLDTADKGDVKAASTQMAAAVRAAPDFPLAKARYSEMLKRLREAGAKREVALSGDETALVESLERYMKGPLTKKNQDAWLCFRGVKGAYLMWKIEQLAGPPKGPHQFRVPAKADLPAVKQAITALWLHELGTIEAATTNIELLKDENFSRSCGMALYYADKENKVYTQLHTLGVTWGDHYRTHPMDVATTLAEWVATGTVRRETLHEAVMFRALPVPSMATDGVLKKMLAVLDSAQAVAEKVPAFMMSEATPELEAARASVLINAGKREEGIAVLQAYLDKYPKSKAYKAIEAQVELLLGISEAAKKNDAAIASCSTDAKAIDRAVDGIIDAEGAAGVTRRLAAIEAKCAPTAALVRQMTVWGYLLRADCASAKPFAEKAAPEEREVFATLCE